ncbi:MAG TPA: hypothetical protein VK327_11065 [Candidatus Paceibacterota bacterium]|nr:hypothetical protein [Candidatus Paceibacterota bacterium]
MSAREFCTPRAPANLFVHRQLLLQPGCQPRRETEIPTLGADAKAENANARKRFASDEMIFQKQTKAV